MEQNIQLDNNTILKNRLLSLGIIDDNSYFEQYIQLIINNMETKRQKHKTQQHHIIPKCYYKQNDLSVDNSSDNLVNLLYKDHILAHYYLCLCVNDKNIKHDCVMAFTYLTDRIDSLKETSLYNLKIDVEYSREQIAQQLPRFQELYEEARKIHGEKMKGRVPWNKGLKSPIKRVAVHNNISTKYVSEEELQIFLNNGWQQGRHDQERLTEIIKDANKGRSPPNKGERLTDEQKEHLRQVNLGKKQSPETIEKRRKSLVGHTVSEETRQRLRDSNVGKKRSDEAKQRMSAAKKGKSPPNKGLPMSNEQKEKLSQGKKGRLWVTNGKEDKMIKSDELIHYEAAGFYRGRSHANSKNINN